MYINFSWIGIDPDPGGDVTVHTVTNLSFAPQTDLTGNTLPVNEYTCDVMTTEEIPYEACSCVLYDDRDQLWCAWPVFKAQKIADNCTRITCRSWLNLLEHKQMAAAMYDGETAKDAIDACFGAEYSNYYTVANSIKNKTISGYAPEQTARERLTWILFVVSGYARDVYRSDVQFTAVDETAALIPYEHTYMRPSVDLGEWVTGLRATTYSYAEGTPQTGDDYVTVDGVDYIVTTGEVILTDPETTGIVRANVVPVEGITLVNSGNVSGILTRLARYWFNRTEVEMEVINNRKYRPGDLVTVYISDDEMATGYIQQASFQFGKQAKSKLKLVGAAMVECAKLTVNFMHNNKRIGRQTYTLPVGYQFSIESQYLDKTTGGHRYIYRPTENAEGTMIAGGLTIDIDYEIALDLYKNVLHIISVDDVTEQSSGGETIGVIA